MMRSLFIASSGMAAQQMNIDIIANNLANVNTTGFKKSRAEFQSLLYQSLRRPAVSESGFFNPTGLEVGNGVRVVGTLTDFGQGIPQETGNDLDVCIEGRGFFMVELPDGRVGFTRGGTFHLDDEGFLVNSSGYPLLTENGTHTGSNLVVDGKTLEYIKPDTETNTISIGLNGAIITEKVTGSNAPVLSLAVITNPSALEAVGGTVYVANDVCGEIKVFPPTTSGVGFLRSGFLEASNVKIVEEMVKMIVAQRAYEINSKSITTSDEILNMTNNLKR